MTPGVMTEPLAALAAPGPLMCMDLHEGIVYGPIRSRRFGCSLGVNLLPPRHKVCSFNCVYCQYGWTEPAARWPDVGWPTPEAVEIAVRQAVGALHAEGSRLDRLTLAGHGEPTLHPQFRDVVERLLVTRDECAPGVPLAILSNSTTAHVPEIRQALLRLDERGMKLDAGDQDDLRHVNATSTPVQRIVDALALLCPITLQAMFVREPQGRVDNTTERAVQAWLRAVDRIRPAAVHLYTIARVPAWRALVPVPRADLKRIAARVRALGIPATVFAS